MSDNSDSIIREVDEEFRRDQMMALWKRYGASFVSATALVIVLVVAWQLWSGWKEGKLRDNAEAYVVMEDRVSTASAADAARIYGEGFAEMEGSYRVLAGLHEAGALMNAGNHEKAIQIYDQVAQLAGDRRIMAFAAYMAASAESAAGLNDAAIARLQALSVPGAPMQYNAMELLAALHAASGDVESARAEFEAILDAPNAPRGMMARAQDMIALFDQEAQLANTQPVATDVEDKSAAEKHEEEGAQQ